VCGALPDQDVCIPVLKTCNFPLGSGFSLSFIYNLSVCFYDTRADDCCQ
jgi:hypothetical protein